MNRIDTIIAALSEQELKEAIRGLRAFDDTGAPAEGAFRRVVDALMENKLAFDLDAVGLSRYALLRAAAYRWADLEAKA